MRIIIKSQNIDLDNVLKTYVNKRFSSLEKILGKLDEFKDLILDIEISKTTEHHKKGEKLYYVECSIRINGALIRIEQYSDDAKSAIDVAKNRLKRVLSDEIKKMRDK